MTEAEWLAYNDPRPMLEFRYRHYPISNRKWTLLDCACCRGVWSSLSDEDKQVVEAGYGFADAEPDGADAAFSAYFATMQRMVGLQNQFLARQNSAELATNATLLREIAGNPFRPVSIHPAWLTPTVLSVAQAAYDNRIPPPGALENARLGVLADALEEAGCDNEEILNHCRQPGGHVRGCWVVDLVLGKE
jgi:hypothetical protein